jgi:hypothetical protein
VSHHSILLQPQADAGALCRPPYTTFNEIQREPSPKVHISASATTYACETRQLSQPVTFAASFLPIPRALIEIARRRGLAVAAAAMDAGFSAPVLRS